MNEFTVNEKAYTLISLNDLSDLELGELEILEEIGGIDLDNLESVRITTKLMIALVWVSMLRTDPSAPLVDAKRVKLNVLNTLAAGMEGATTGEDAADPPTVPAANGVPDSESVLASVPGTWPG